MPIFALVDCNNFFVSCERAFRPDLQNKPVAVLSNNDGCVVARSNEVKAMGVPMGVPYFKVRSLMDAGKVTLFSGNFSLYGDFSQRVVQILADECPSLEAYSVDESFLDISNLPIKDYKKWGCDLSAKILQWTGIPVSVGIANNKTLAKAAADYTKKNDCNGCHVVLTDKSRVNLLKWLPVGDVWGVGRATVPKLMGRGIKTAYEFSQLPDNWALHQLHIGGLKTVKELRGESYFGLTTVRDPQKSIIRSRSFGDRVRNYYELESAVATFAAQAAVKLRSEGETTGAVMTYLRGSKHAKEVAGGSYVTKLHPASANTGEIIAAALKNLSVIYDSQVGYKKAGIALLNLKNSSSLQLSFDSSIKKIAKDEQLMQVLDEMNSKLGTRLIRHASEHLELSGWRSRRQLRSPAYTTNWSEILTIR